MSGFDLPNNYTDNLGATPKEETVSYHFFFCYFAYSRTSHPRTIRYYHHGQVTPRLLHLAVANVLVGPTVNTSTRNFELWTGLITMVQANQFCGLASEDANAHLQYFLELCNTIIIKDVTPASIRLCLFPFSLPGKVK